MPQQPVLVTRREEARAAMEGDERRAARLRREQAIGRRRIDARLAMESPTHRARREVRERAKRESTDAAMAQVAAERASRAAAERLVAENEGRTKAQAAAEQAARMTRVSNALQAAAEIKTMEGKPIHLSAIRTLKTDMAAVVGQGGSIAGAIIRAGELNTGRLGPPAPRSQAMLTTILILLLLGAIAAGGTLFYQKWRASSATPVTENGLTTTTPNPGQVSIIVTDSHIDINVTDQNTIVLLGEIREQRASSATIGTIDELVFSKNVAPLAFRAWRILLALPFPDDLTRIVEPTFMFGFYRAATSSIPFIILKTKSAEKSYTQLLAWEKNLPTVWDILIGKPPADLSPLKSSTGTATIAPRFRDQLIQNLDTRILDGPGVAQPALYGFLDSDTIILTQTRAAFLEILTRFRAAR